jgi:hexosaminidase
VLETEGVFHDKTTVTLSTDLGGTVRYTLDGAEPSEASPIYKKPFPLDRRATVRAALFREGLQVGHGSRRTLVHVQPVENQALGKPVTASVPGGPLFSPARLTDGGTGNLDYFLGYPAMPEPISITVDLGKKVSFDRIVIHSHTSGSSYESYEIHVSPDGKAFEQVAKRLEKPAQFSGSVVHDVPAVTARYVRVLTHGHKQKVFDSFSRLTEIQVFSTGPQEGAGDSSKASEAPR